MYEDFFLSTCQSVFVFVFLLFDTTIHFFLFLVFWFMVQRVIKIEREKKVLVKVIILINKWYFEGGFMCVCVLQDMYLLFLGYIGSV